MPSLPTWFLVLQATASFAIVLTFIIYYLQLRAMRQQLAAAREASRSQNLISIIGIIQQPGLPADRGVLTGLRDVPFNDWRDDQKEAAKRACSAYDIAAILIQGADSKIRDTIIRNWGHSMKNCCEVATDLITEERKTRPERWKPFTDLCSQLRL